MRRTEYFRLGGGINDSTPAMSVSPGELINAQNYVCMTEGGYRRIDGYERFDGQHLPSPSVYAIFNFTAGSSEPNYGDVITGGASGARAAVLEVNVTSGTFGTGDAAGFFVIHIESGEFVSGEPLNIYRPDAFSSGFNSGFF